MNDPKVSIYLEPAKRKVNVQLGENATVGEVVQGMVTHLRQIEGFDLDVHIRDRIGDGFDPEWQLFREGEAMQLLPPGARFRDFQPPLEDDESFTIKVNAKVASAPPMDIVLAATPQVFVWKGTIRVLTERVHSPLPR